MSFASDDGGVALFNVNMDRGQNGADVDSLPKLLATSTHLSSRDTCSTSRAPERIYNPPKMSQPSKPSAPGFCTPCNRQFKNTNALRNHIRDSRYHRLTSTDRQPVSARNNVSESTISSFDRIASDRTATTPTVNDMADLGSEGFTKREDPNLLLSSIGTQFEDKDGARVANDSLQLELPDLLHGKSHKSTDAQSKTLLPVISIKEINSKSGHKWSPVPLEVQPTIMEVLRNHCHSQEDLSKHRYRLRPYVPHEIAGFKRCKKCGLQQKKAKKPGHSLCRFHTGTHCLDSVDGKKSWSCCQKEDKGCVSVDHHEYMSLEPEIVEKYQRYGATPKNLYGDPRRKAISIDCEMAGVEGGYNELIQVCVVDYVTGDVLLDKLVQPLGKVIDWRTRCHGVTAEAMRDAVCQGQALRGWQGARRELWKLIDWDTIIVGHALQNDLDALGIIHSNVVDSEILASRAIGPLCSQFWGLKSMCEELLNVRIQTKGKDGHECLEDAFAVRELVLWCTWNPIDFRAWARVKTEEEQHKVYQREVEKKKRVKEKEKEKGKRAMEAGRKGNAEDEEDDEEESGASGGPDGSRKRRDSVLYGYLDC